MMIYPRRFDKKEVSWQWLLTGACLTAMPSSGCWPIMPIAYLILNPNEKVLQSVVGTAHSAVHRLQFKTPDPTRH